MLEEALADFEGSVLVVSHDRYFLDRICDQIVAFEENGAYVQPGNYSYYLEKRKQREQTRVAPPAPAAAGPAEEPALLKPSRPRKLTFKEAAIHAAEARVSELENTLSAPDFYPARAREAPGLIAELEAGKAEVARLYARWEELGQLAN